jgi:DNA-binding winged helix-turn-helix (wHTH) protein
MAVRVNCAEVKMKLRLGELTFDAGTRQLLRGREEVHLSPRAFDLLKVLIDERPRAVAKAELHELLWPATFVSETNLASLVAEIRKATGDSAHHPRLVRTVHRFGYAFCGELAGPDRVPPPEPDRFCWLLWKGRRYPLQAGENVLGRGAHHVMRLDSPTVSRRHARLTVSGTEVVIDDLGSKNGTFVRGKRLSDRTSLEDGDEIRVGSVILRFRTTSGTSTATWTGPVDRGRYSPEGRTQHRTGRSPG